MFRPTVYLVRHVHCFSDISSYHIVPVCPYFALESLETRLNAFTRSCLFNASASGTARSLASWQPGFPTSCQQVRNFLDFFAIFQFLAPKNYTGA